MKRSIKKQWIDDLLSGQFKQGQEALCRVDRLGDSTYCCLGVLAIRIGEENGGLSAIDFKFTTKDGFIESSGISIPERTAKELGIMFRMPDNEYLLDKLIALNDSYLRNFAFIAGFIEAVVPEEAD